MVLNHLETPGLGAKIESEDFTAQYKGKSLENPELWEVTKDGGTFIPITGATISSRAITRAAAKGLILFQKHKEEIFGKIADSGTVEAEVDSATVEEDEVEGEVQE